MRMFYVCLRRADSLRAGVGRAVALQTHGDEGEACF